MLKGFILLESSLEFFAQFPVTTLTENLLSMRARNYSMEIHPLYGNPPLELKKCAPLESLKSIQS